MTHVWGMRAAVSQALILWLSGSATAASFPCGELADKVLNDGEVYLRNSRSWDPISPGAVVDKAGLGRFIYVIKAWPGSERSGILVIKTGRQVADPKLDLPSNKKYVRLERNEVDVSKNERCPFQPFSPKSVASIYYDQYHDGDYELRGQEGAAALRTFNDFHTNYETANSVCKHTANTGWDSFYPFDRRSNRSQYSFDKTVVATGLSSPTFNFFRSTAPHGSDGLMEQKVESIRYQTVNQLACIPIYPPTTQGSFLRINDLEGRNLATFLRPPEIEIIFAH